MPLLRSSDPHPRLLSSFVPGSIEPRSLMEPIRKFCRRVNLDAHYIQAECTSIDHVAQSITVKPVTVDSPPITLQYDTLVIAVGADPNTFDTVKSTTSGGRRG